MTVAVVPYFAETVTVYGALVPAGTFAQRLKAAAAALGTVLVVADIAESK